MSATPLGFSLSPAEIEKTSKEEMEKFKTALDAIGATPDAKVNLASTLLALEAASTEFGNAVNPVLFLKYVSPSAEVRAAADRCENEVQRMFVDIFVREDLFNALQRLADTKPTLTREEKQLLEEYQTQFKRNGLALSAEKRNVFVEKKKRLVFIESEFNKRLVEWDDFLELTPGELDGLPESFVKGLARLPNGNFKLTLDYPHYYPFMENAKNAEARKKLEFKFNNRGGEQNRRYLEEAIALRHELAQMLGYENHAAFVLERRMAKQPDAVAAFLKRLGEKLKVKGQADLHELLETKRAHLNDPAAGDIHAWDWRYYANILKKTKYQVDTQVIKEYFPLDTVLRGMFELYEQLLGVRYVEMQKAAVWHPSVKLYHVTCNGETVAYFYMDLFPREGKYGHAAAFTLTSEYLDDKRGRFVPSSSIVANFNPPTAEKPALMEHSEVETLFHEFGHIMHQVLTRARFATFSGTNVKTDYVEAPSQMLENWVWQKASLEKLSGHYRDPKKHLPQELIDKMVRAKNANSGIKYLRQVSFGMIDMAYHTSAKVDSTEIYKRYMRDVMLIPLQDGTEPQASFGHLMGGYDSGYYGYLWSEVFAQDMFTRFEKEGLLNGKTGEEYRKWILEEGGQKEPAELIRGFLGRESNEEAFLRKLGI